MENIVCSRYSVIGIKDVVYRLKDAIENSDGNVSKVLQNLGLATCNFGDSELLSKIQWRVLGVTDFDDINECKLEFEENCPLKHSNIIDRLVCDEDIFDDKINLIVKPLTEGYIINKTIIISEKEIFNKKDIQTTYRTNFKIGSKVRDINKLEIGDYIVHNVHGIGRYCGIKTLVKNGLKKDYLMLEYKGEDKLYIPVEKIDRISKFFGKEGVSVKLNSLSNDKWQKRKARVKGRLEEIAANLIKVCVSNLFTLLSVFCSFSCSLYSAKILFNISV